MAQPIRMSTVARDPRSELKSRLDAATTDHAEALLAALEVLQGLHDCGVLELLRGATGSSEKVLEIAVDAAKTPTSIRSIRNLILLVNMVGEIQPELLKAFTSTIPLALETISEHPEPPALWRLGLGLLRNPDSRRGIAALNTVLETFGRELAATRAEK
ncbi:DUF1641 domain-containing protein [Schlesneria paludicola]|uniref:DUF1641 domain-containing protein n=1 Tax=Schlesneria paludicola TaxID=360056 RepID=UPI00029AB1BC|nr:hypothetical protein [Schlesneria paludicola]